MSSIYILIIYGIYMPFLSSLNASLSGHFKEISPLQKRESEIWLDGKWKWICFACPCIPRAKL